MESLIRVSIRRPIAVAAMVVMVVLFGVVAFRTIPIQLTPDINKPVISVKTNWPGAAPAEVEREIINKQEEVLKGLTGLEKMLGQAQSGRSEITLELAIGTDMDRALLLTANRLNRVGSYPDEADKPVLDTSGSEDSPIAWTVIKRATGNLTPIHTYGDFARDVVQERIERVPGVSRVNVFGGSEREMRVQINAARLVQYGLTVPDVITALRSANASVTAGAVEEGKRRYVVRTQGEFATLQQVRAVVLRSSRTGASGRLGRVTIGDIADVRFDYKAPTAVIRRMGDAAIAVNIVRETGANVIDTMAGIRAAIAELNAGPLSGAGLVMKQVYDETIYIDAAIDLVTQNIYVGGLLAAFVLMLFLRSGGATLVVSLAIPVSVIGSFVAMSVLGRSLNVISLAGIAFAVGMVVDAAIVVLENIFRLRQEGKSRFDAAYEGTRQVWAAVMVSALTTVMVFIPVLILDLEIGQLFRDIAVAISVSVVLSLLVAITLIPGLSRRLLGEGAVVSVAKRRLPVIDPLATGFVNGIVSLTGRVIASRGASVAVVGGITTVAALATAVFLPRLDYLPTGNRNLVFGVILPPPGYNLATTTGAATRLESAFRPLWSMSEAEKDDKDGPPAMKDFFFVATNTSSFIGAAAEDPDRAKELIPVMQRPVFDEPGTWAVIRQTSLFGRGIGSGRSVELNISGPDLAHIFQVATRAAALVAQHLPRSDGNQLRPRPALQLGAPEVRLMPDRISLADNGVSVRELGQTIDTYNDGLRVAEITVQGRQIDLTLTGSTDKVNETQGIGALPVVTRSGTILPASSLAEVTVTNGPTQIRHLERFRTVTLDISPADGVALEDAMNIVKDQVIAVLQQQGVPDGIRFSLSGTADQLTRTWNAMLLDLLLAIVIVYLVMAVLFESFRYPLIILFSVPLATAGGVGGLALLNLYQPQNLDMLTLLGFVILIGIVVNNAILLVHQSLHYLKEEALAPKEAILAATRNRIRPIFMSTLTSVFGMMPLVVFPGAGSELYRGLGSVVLGGLSLSALLTLAIIPPLLGLVLRERPADDAAHRQRVPGLG